LLKRKQHTQTAEQSIPVHYLQSAGSSTMFLWFNQFSVSFNNHPCTTSLGLILLERSRRPTLHRLAHYLGNQYGIIILVHHLSSAKVIFGVST
jgi:hypothetical protein